MIATDSNYATWNKEMNNFDYDAHIRNVVENYKGDVTVLGNAIGMLVLLRYVGWKVIRIVYSAETCLKYERILGVKIKEIAPERGEFAYKSLGLMLIDMVGGYWNFVAQRKGPPELKKGYNIFA